MQGNIPTLSALAHSVKEVEVIGEVYLTDVEWFTRAAAACLDISLLLIFHRARMMKKAPRKAGKPHSSSEMSAQNEIPTAHDTTGSHTKSCTTVFRECTHVQSNHKLLETYLQH
jgi:hypothetical protein